MARARNIKPAIFKNELLGVADPLLMQLFISLWTLADKRGRLEDRPLRIKAETFPYREGLDVNGYLTELERLGFICRYEVNGVAIIQVENFTKHQTPHKTEKESELPAKPANEIKNQTESVSCPLTVKQPLSNEKITEALPPDLLIPDLLIPDSLESAPPQAATSKRGSRLSPNWKLTPEFVEAAKEINSSLDDIRLLTIASTFRDYWVSKAGKDGAKLDWLATWRNWIRREPAAPRTGGPPPNQFQTAREKNAQRNAEIFDLEKARDF